MEHPAAHLPVVAWSFGDFVKTMLAEGRAVVSREPLQVGGEASGECLKHWHELAAGELAGSAPGINIESAAWGATMLYSLCQFVACRDLGKEAITAACRVKCPGARGPETDFSADLSLRHLPELYKLARHLSNAVPLLDEMKRLGAAWPLSSVGMPGLEAIHIDSFVDHQALRLLYVDRIIAAGDLTRLGNARIDEALRAAIGAHSELAPEIAARLKLNALPNATV